MAALANAHMLRRETHSIAAGREDIDEDTCLTKLCPGAGLSPEEDGTSVLDIETGLAASRAVIGFNLSPPDRAGVFPTRNSLIGETIWRPSGVK